MGKSFRVAQEPNQNRKPEPPEPFFQEPKEEPEPPEPFFGNRNRNRIRRSLLNSTETQEKGLRRGTTRTENPEPLEPLQPQAGATLIVGQHRIGNI